MQKIVKLKILIFIYATIQFSFMFLYTPISGSFDLFPLFTWNIFRPYPKTPDWYYIVKIKEVNGRSINPPMEIIDFKEGSFKNIHFYSFTQRLQSWGMALHKNDYESSEKFRKEIEADFLVFNFSVVYEFKRIEIHPIEYKTKGEIINSVVLHERRINRDF